MTSLNRRKNSVVKFNLWHTHYLPKIIATRSQTSKPYQYHLYKHKVGSGVYIYDLLAKIFRDITVL